MFACGILGFGIRNTAQGIRISHLRIGIRDPSSFDKESGIQYLESRIPGVESRIQDCLGFPYKRRTNRSRSKTIITLGA